MRIVQGAALTLGALALAGALFPNSLIPVGHAIAQSFGTSPDTSDMSDGGDGSEEEMVVIDPTYLLFRDFYEADRQSLLLSQSAGSLCFSFDCTGFETEVAEKIALFAISEREREEQSETQAESRWLARIGLACSAFGAFLGFMAFRRSQAADAAATRNTEEMTALKKQTGV
jgi:hypothetical protein